MQIEEYIVDIIVSAKNEYFKLNINNEIKCQFSSKCSDLDTCQYLQKCKDYYNLKGKLDLYTLFKSKTLPISKSETISP